MQFPEAKRIIYHKNPLDEVICQFRFPPNLSIETEIPSKFQELIRDEYPLFNEKVEVQFKISEDPNIQLPEILNLPPSASKHKNYEFLSSDEKWKINLTRSFLALSTIDYTRWENFKTHLLKPFDALLAIYSPLYFPRVGLRYRDNIKRSELGLENVPWSELLQPYILGLLNVPQIGEEILNINHVTELNLDDQSIVRIANGLAHDLTTKETHFVIDSDFFTTTKTETNEALGKLDYFNSQGSRLIQWSITKRLHEAMEPEIL